MFLGSLCLGNIWRQVIPCAKTCLLVEDGKVRLRLRLLRVQCFDLAIWKLNPELARAREAQSEKITDGRPKRVDDDGIGVHGVLNTSGHLRRLLMAYRGGLKV